MFKNKNLLITGGTGSFGNAVLRRFLDSDIAEIRIFSRDEKKQDDKGDAVQRLCGNLQVDISKARSLLGWVPPVSVEEGLRRAMAV